MIHCERRILKNGLTVLVHEDFTSPLVAINILYKVGSKNEPQHLTGLTHLFEHLMFSGSKHIPDYDDPIQRAGGENNAFTNADITNFYIILPAENVELGLWLEADRMKDLKLTKKALEIQKKVVVEEFKETCLNEPYGDAWHHISDLAYLHHPYKWPTIGKEPGHIEAVTIDDAKQFYNQYYAPNNAIICLSGGIKKEKAFELVEKWFAHIPGGDIQPLVLAEKEELTNVMQKVVHANVPSTAIYLAFKMENRLHHNYYTTDIISDILSSGRSSRMYQNLIKEKQLFTFIDAYISGTTDPGLFVIDGRLADGVEIEVAQKAIWEELDQMCNTKVDERELEKIKNKAVSNLTIGEAGVLNKAMGLAYYEYLGDVNLINSELNLYQAITAESLQEDANTLFRKDGHVELIYMPSS